jgi:mono/diheme cytochrome c family protein
MVYPPRDTVDQLMARGLISADIPEIRRQAVEVYQTVYETTEAGINRIGSLASFYETYYPDYYAQNTEQINAAIAALQEAYRGSVYPEQKSDWASHPSNVGHQDTPGCFRCHDGKHLSSAGEAIRLECNLCHSIPVVSGPNQFVADIEISRGPEPQSHRNANWISVHHDIFDSTCANCHTTENPGGTDNTSFCSNSACHGSAWGFAGFNAPGLREIVLAQLPPTPTPEPLPSGGALTFNETIGPLFAARCGDCHIQTSIQGLNLGTYAAAMQGGDSGPVILSGDPHGSLLVQKQSGEQPHFGQLTSEELELVVQWIAAGAPEN